MHLLRLCFYLLTSEKAEEPQSLAALIDIMHPYNTPL